MTAPEELIPIHEAQALLGISKATMTRILKESGMWTGRDLIDKRIRLVRRADIDALLAHSAARKKVA
jgi:hypothetical protein